MAPLFLMRVRLALTLTVFGCGLASAQNVATRTWTLEECLGHAFEHNLQLKQTELGLRTVSYTHLTLPTILLV